MSLVLKRKINKWILTVVILILALIYVYPIFLMCINAVKPFGEVVVDVIKLPSKVEWSNITYVMDKMQYGKLFLNNVEITVIGIVGIVIFSSLTAYILDRKRNRYTSFAKTSKVGLGIQYWGFGIPMATFIFFNFMETIPREIDESAYIDGADTFKTFSLVIFPLLKSVTFTVIVIDVMWIWNDFLLPLLMVNSSNDTKTLVLAAYSFVGQFNTQWHYAMASMVLAILPSVVIFILLQKYIVEGVVAGAVKG